MKNEKINSKMKLSNIFRYFNIRNFKILKYWSFYISSLQIFTPTQRNLQAQSSLRCFGKKKQYYTKNHLKTYNCLL